MPAYWTHKQYIDVAELNTSGRSSYQTSSLLSWLKFLTPYINVSFSHFNSPWLIIFPDEYAFLERICRDSGIEITGVRRIWISRDAVALEVKLGNQGVALVRDETIWARKAEGYSFKRILPPGRHELASIINE